MPTAKKYVIFVNRESIIHFNEIIKEKFTKSAINQLYDGRFIASYTAMLSEDELLVLKLSIGDIHIHEGLKEIT